MKFFCSASPVKLLPVLFFFFAIGANAQVLKIHDAEAHVEAGQYRDAEKIYLDILKKSPESYEANYGIALLYSEFLNDLQTANSYVNKAVSLSGKDTTADLLFAYAKCRHFFGKYDEAIKYYKRCASIVQKNDEGKKLKSQINGYVNNCQFAKDHPASKNVVRYKVKNAGTEINSKFADYVPVVNDHENVMLFTSRRRETTPDKVDKSDEKVYENIYIATGDKNKYGHARRIRLSGEEPADKAKRHESVVDISGDGKKVITFYDGDLYECELKGDSTYGAVTKLNDNINSEYYQNHASTTADGKMIFFASDRAGGKGKLDLYYAQKKSNGLWETPVNMGELINTDEDEESPEISPDGKTLVFASKGLPGYGKYDLFRTEFKNGKWTTPENLGAPVNSPADDIYLRYNADHTVAWFSSSRPEGFGDMDIYQLYYVDVPDFKHAFPFVAGETNDKVTFTCKDSVGLNEQAKFDASATSVAGMKVLHYYWKVGDSLLASDKSVTSFAFSKNGNYKVKLEVTLDCDTCSAHQMYFVERNIYAGEIKKDVLVSNGKDTSLNVIPELEKIYFDFNKSDLTQTAKDILDRNLTLLKTVPNAKLDITAFTDARGNGDYNEKLSRKRAKSVKAYLIKNGFSSKRIGSVEAMGEKNPVNSCGDGVECTEDQYAKNRRAELKVYFVK